MNNLGDYYFEVTYSMIEINNIIGNIGYRVTINVDPKEASTMTGFDNTYVIRLLDINNNEVGKCVLVVDNFTISINKIIYTNTTIFVDYTEINDNYKGIGLSKIFILFQVLLSIQLKYVNIVSNDTAIEDGIFRYKRYLFNKINGDIWYSENDDSDDEINSDIINNILIPENIIKAKDTLINRINDMMYEIKYLKYKKKYIELKSGNK
jgi:hypothetical protein